jgi:peptidoglycan/LPS O-acetylase OafA/YrhL
MKPDHHLPSLDGLRGIAILSVVGFHYFYINAAPFNQTEIYPYRDAFVGWTIFQYGFLGVPLFFMISGFVIALTLEKCATPWDFAIRRFARIWPALLVWSTLTFFFLHFSNSPFALTTHQTLEYFIPSWTLLPEALWATVFPGVRLIDNVYWSLVVEFRFYLFAAIVYWSSRRMNFARNFAVFTISAVLLNLAAKSIFPGRILSIFGLVFLPEHLPWFAAGAIFYQLYKGELNDWLGFILLLIMYAFLAKLSLPRDYCSTIVMGAISFGFFAVFYAVAKFPKFIKAFETPALVYVGTWSYSIYLIHSEIGTSIISGISSALGTWTSFSLVIALIFAMIALGYASYRLIEQPARKLITNAAMAAQQLGRPSKS